MGHCFFKAQLMVNSSVELAHAGRQEPVPTQEEVDLVVAQIRQVCRNSTLEFALHVGAIIIHNFYGGELKDWRLRGAKAPSFRRLAQHPELPLSPGALCRCVAVFELCDRLNAAARFRRLGASHFRMVLGLDGKTQEQLLEMANKQHWTVKALHEEAMKHRGREAPCSGGRRPQSSLTKSLNAIRRILQAFHASLDEPLHEREHAEFRESVQLLFDTREWVDRLCREVAERNPGIASGAAATAVEEFDASSELTRHGMPRRHKLDAAAAKGARRVSRTSQRRTTMKSLQLDAARDHR
jgi:hypothetical protein